MNTVENYNFPFLQIDRSESNKPNAECDKSCTLNPPSHSRGVQKITMRSFVPDPVKRINTDNLSAYDKMSKFYVGPTEKIETNSSYKSLNQALVGPPNPKTLVRPVVVDPIYDLSRLDSETTVPTAINKRSVQYLKDSGYFCDSINYNIDYSKINFDPYKRVPESQKSREESRDKSGKYDIEVKEDYSSGNNAMYEKNQKVYPKYEYLDLQGNDRNCGYNRDNFRVYGAPNNVPLAEGDLNKLENDRLFTSYLQPGIYSKTEMVQPPVWNMGISYQEKKNPNTTSIDRDGNLVYTERELGDYKTTRVESMPLEYILEPTQEEVYDPRLTGYGSQKRAYIEPTIGQPRYMYKDIDAMRRGNFFVRSNIDHLPFAQQSGLMKDNIYNNIQRCADLSYIDINNNFRSDIQESLMSKRNAELWQLRKFPLRRDQRTKC